MRKIRFREWDSKYKLMRGVNGLKDLFTIRSDGKTSDDYVLMMFTGLHDKNGKEVFENDLVKRRYNTFKVLWFDEGAGFIFQNVKDNDDCWCPNEYSVANEWVVIGNIYENPDMVKTPEKVIDCKNSASSKSKNVADAGT